MGQTGGDSGNRVFVLSCLPPGPDILFLLDVLHSFLYDRSSVSPPNTPLLCVL